MRKDIPCNIMVQPYMAMYAQNYHSLIQKSYGISHFYEFTIDEMKNQIQAVPDGSVDLLFEIGSQKIRTYIGGTVLKAKQWPFMIGERYFGIRFQPGRCVLPEGLKIQQIIDCDLEIDGNSFGSRLPELIAEKNTLQECASVFLKNYLQKNQKDAEEKYKVSLEGYIQKRICESRGNISIRELAEETGYTECYIRRVFKKIHGISPKVFARFVRFQNLLKQMEHFAEINQMEEMALSCGYYDQSHMIKDFKCFAGMTPESYLHLIRQNNRKMYKHRRF